MDSKQLNRDLDTPSGKAVFDFGICLGDIEQAIRNRDIVSSNHQVAGQGNRFGSVFDSGHGNPTSGRIQGLAKGRNQGATN